MSRGLYLFRKDWRIQDNPLLARACRDCDELIYIWICPPIDQVGHVFSIDRASSLRRVFVRESIDDLKDKLATIGAQLVVRFGDMVSVLHEVYRGHSFQQLYAEALPGTEEEAEWKAIVDFCERNDVQAIQQWQRTLIRLCDLPFGLNNLPKVFTTFRTKVEQNWRVRDIVEIDSFPNCIVLDSDAWPELYNSDVEMDSRASLVFKGGSKQGFDRLKYYCVDIKRLGKYKETRNGLTGADYSSKLSPWLAYGCISPVEVYQEIRGYEEQYGANESSYCLIFELLWRDFFQFTALKEGKRLYQRNGFGEGQLPQRKFSPIDFAMWCEGRTGNAFVDACMRELLGTGYMSNRGRQNAASFLVHDLHVDWRLGASFFEYHLLDYDVASNWCNWAYIAGVGNDPRAGRKFNVDKQANDYDADGSFRNLWT
jgi:deoxyribodipyrimidine photo-lyase